VLRLAPLIVGVSLAADVVFELVFSSNSPPVTVYGLPEPLRLNVPATATEPLGEVPEKRKLYGPVGMVPGAGLTTNWRLAEAVFLAASVTVNCGEVALTPVGVPEMVPVLDARESPAGRAGLVPTLHVRGGTPPLVVSVWL
jgi:hypothetical protein